MPKTSSKRSRGNGDGSLSQDPKSGVWIAFYFDADGRRRKRSTKTTNRRDADTLRARWAKEVRDVRAGLVDPDALRRRDESGVSMLHSEPRFAKRTSTGVVPPTTSAPPDSHTMRAWRRETEASESTRPPFSSRPMMISS